MAKLIKVTTYKKALKLWLQSDISMSNIAKLCEINKSTLSVWIREWESWDLKRPVDKYPNQDRKRAIDSLLSEE